MRSDKVGSTGRGRLCLLLPLFPILLRLKLDLPGAREEMRRGRERARYGERREEEEAERGGARDEHLWLLLVRCFHSRV